MSHTPGPWTVLYGGHGTDGYFVIASRGGDTLICDSSPRQLLPEVELNANARLIAHAPALLSVLESIIDAHPDGVCEAHREMARKVIAEVRGIKLD